MRIIISSGHGLKVRGASDILDEVDEARRVVNQVATNLRALGVDVGVYHDDISTTQSENLNRIVSHHNAQTRDLDVSVHFNAYQTTSKPMGTEVLYLTQPDLAADVSAAIADAGGFLDRGPKKRTDLAFLNNTDEPAILIETCFVDSSADAELYQGNFAVICVAIADAIAGDQNGFGDVVVPDDERPMLRKGDAGPDVQVLQVDLNRELEGCELVPDGDFGSKTDMAVRDYQASRGLDVDGVVGEQTWDALDTHMPPYVPPGLPEPLELEHQQAIADIASSSAIADYSWKDRGRAPFGYIEGFALAWANTYRQWLMDYPAAVEMAKANTDDTDVDVLAWYDEEFRAVGMDNSSNGKNTLRHLWALMLGLGMRESSGRHCEGRDTSADNTTSDTAEAGLFQTSWNAHNSSDSFDMLFDAFRAGKGSDNPQGFLNYFEKGVSCDSASWSCYGSGDGYEFQYLCKHMPAFACETCAIVLRNLRQHYGPINRQEAELKTDADVMLKAVQDYVDRMAGEV